MGRLRLLGKGMRLVEKEIIKNELFNIILFGKLD